MTSSSPENQRLQRELMQEPADVAQRLRADDSALSAEAEAIVADSEQFEAKLRQAVDISAKDQDDPRRWLRAVDLPEATKRRPLWMTSMAAALVGAIGVGLALTPRDSQAQRLQTAMIDHYSNEASELGFHRDHVAIDPQPMSDGAFSAGAEQVMYLNLCVVDGELAVHAIVETTDGNVTALYVPSRDIRSSRDVSSDGTVGRMADAGDGVNGFFSSSEAALAAITERHGAQFAAEARKLLAAKRV